MVEEYKLEKETEKLLEKKNKGYRVGEKIRKETIKGVRKFKQVDKKLYTVARKEIKPRKVLKKGKMSYKLREYQPDNVLMHSNKFFTDNYQQEKRSLFFT